MSHLLASVGFTGTRRGMNDAQKDRLRSYIAQLKPAYFHFGDAIGADSQAFDIVREVMPGCEIIAHPCRLWQQRAFRDANYIHSEEAPISRNHAIVNASRVLLAAPFELQEQLRSGTWATIRYARRMQKQIVLIRP